MTGDRLEMYLRKYHGQPGLEAISYAEICYGESATIETYDIYNNRTISYSNIHSASCPFSGHTCLEGDTSVYTLVRGLGDSNDLGINAERRYHFRRKMTCAPLITNASLLGLTLIKNTSPTMKICNIPMYPSGAANIILMYAERETVWRDIITARRLMFIEISTRPLQSCVVPSC
jgi:hypothetical protein